MVRVLVRDQDPASFLPFDLQFFQAFLDSFFADPCIYEQVRIIAPHIDTVAAAPAGNAAHSHNPNLSPICLFVSSKSPLLSMTAVHTERNRSSPGCDAIICVILSSVYPRDAFRRSRRTCSSV